MEIPKLSPQTTEPGNRTTKKTITINDAEGELALGILQLVDRYVSAEHSRAVSQGLARQEARTKESKNTDGE
ncbi:hypothetical protein AB0L41_36355 [Amycolatopsis mediterranei]|uniref:hypothetical protein n=1 Tax=Amycolatopsis mediterranei TaxID=33910 RepID=UPI003423EFB1